MGDKIHALPDDVQQMINQPTPTERTAYEAIGIPLTLAGALLRASGSPLGAPLGLLGGGLFATGYSGGKAQARQKQIADIIEATEPTGRSTQRFGVDKNGNVTDLGAPASRTQTLNKLLAVPGESAGEAFGTVGQLYSPGKWQFVNEPGVAPYEINTVTGDVRPVNAPTRPAAAPKTRQLPGDFAIAAGELGLPTDPAKLTASDYTRIQRKVNQNRLAGTKGTVVNLGSLGQAVDKNGNIVEVNRDPRTGATKVTPYPAGVTPLGMLKKPAAASKPPAFPKSIRDAYTPTPSTTMPGAWYLAPNPNAPPATGLGGMVDTAKGALGLGSAPTPPLLFIPKFGVYLEKGDTIPGTTLQWDGNP